MSDNIVCVFPFGCVTQGNWTFAIMIIELPKTNLENTNSFFSCWCLIFYPRPHFRLFTEIQQRLVNNLQERFMSKVCKTCQNWKTFINHSFPIFQWFCHFYPCFAIIFLLETVLIWSARNRFIISLYMINLMDGIQVNSIKGTPLELNIYSISSWPSRTPCTGCWLEVCPWFNINTFNVK